MTFQKKINRRGQKHLESLAEAIQLEWKRALEYDGIPDDGCKFVVFSDDNPHCAIRDKLLERYWHEKAAYRAGGYVGLRIVNGKAVI